MRATAVGGLAAGIVAAAALGAAAAFVVATGLVGPECPDFDDEGTTAAPGSVYAAVLCRGYDSVPSALLVPGAVALVVATVLAVVLARRRTSGPGPDAFVAVAVPVAAAALVPLLTLVLLHGVLPRECLGGDGADGGDPACETDRERL